uniref:Uncharacterized protein n=1 Tax=Peromyscus maniculatus bairdii TaxID=230844 RepID=A0A8C8UCV1_PERMB
IQPTLKAVSSCTAPPSPRSRRSTRPPRSRLSRSRSRSTSGSMGGMVGVGAGVRQGRTEAGGRGGGAPLNRILSWRLLATKWVRSPWRLTVPSSSKGLEMVARRPPPAPASPLAEAPPPPHAPLSPSRLRLSWRRLGNERPARPAASSSSSSSSGSSLSCSGGSTFISTPPGLPRRRTLGAEGCCFSLGSGCRWQEDGGGASSGPAGPRRPPAPDGVARRPGRTSQASGSGRWTLLLPPLDVFGDARGGRLATPAFSASSSPDPRQTQGGFEGVRTGWSLKAAAGGAAAAESSGSGPGRPRPASILRGGGRNLQRLAGLRGGGGAFKGRRRRSSDWQTAETGTDGKDSVIGCRPRKFRPKRCYGAAEHTGKPVG